MFKRTSIALIALATAGGLGACTSVSDKQESSELAAQSATTNFPTSASVKTSDRVGVIVDRDTQSIRILNFGNALANVDVWINGTYLYHAEVVPGNGSEKLDLSKFYDHSGHAITEHEVRINSVQIASADGKTVWTLLGPITNP